MGLDCANHSEWFFTILLVEDPGLYKKVVKEDRQGRHAAFPWLLPPAPALTYQSNGLLPGPVNQ